MFRSTTTIRMSASQWTVEIRTEKGPMLFDLRQMSRDERRKFHAEFMSAYRRVHPYQPRNRVAA